MSLRNAYKNGQRDALARFKIAMPMPQPQLSTMQTAATAMPTAPVKPAVPPAAPVATHAPKSNVLG